MDRISDAMELFSRKEYRERHEKLQKVGDNESKTRTAWYKYVRPGVKAAFEKIIPTLDPDKFPKVKNLSGATCTLSIVRNASEFIGDFMDYRSDTSYTETPSAAYSEIASLKGYDGDEYRIKKLIANFLSPFIREINKVANIFTIEIEADGENMTAWIMANFASPVFQKMSGDGTVDSFVAFESLLKRTQHGIKPKYFEKPAAGHAAARTAVGGAIIGIIVAGIKVNVEGGFGMTMFSSAIGFGLIASGIWNLNEAMAKKWMTKHPSDAEAASLNVLEHKYVPIINSEATKLSKIVTDAASDLKEAGFEVKPGPGMKKNRNPYSMAGNCAVYVKATGAGHQMNHDTRSTLHDALKEKIEDLDEELIEKYDGKIRVATAYTDKYCGYFIILNWFNRDGLILPNLE